MDTICESVPPCVYTIDDSLSGGIVVEQSPVGGGDIDDDGLLHLLNVPVDEPPLGVSDFDDDHASSVATTELDTSGDESGDHETAPPGDPRFVSMHRDWWRGTNGVVDLRPFGPGVAATSGRVHRYCETTIGRLLGAGKAHGDVVFKVGTAHDVFEKFNSYVQQDPKPFSHMFLLHRTCTKEGAGFLAASLIKQNWTIPRFVNKERRDMGGEGGGASGCSVYVIAGAV